MPADRSAAAVLVLTVLAVGACGPPRPAGTAGSAPAVLASVKGLASYYGPGLHGQRTASGSVFNQHQLVAAHPRYPFGTIVRVTNLENDRVVVVRIVDRGPVKRQQRKGVIIDLSAGAARRLRMVRDGVVKVRLDVLGWGEAAVRPGRSIPGGDPP